MAGSDRKRREAARKWGGNPSFGGGRPMYWVLRGHKAVPAKDVIEWGVFFEEIANRRVAEDFIRQPEQDPVRVSTVFIGMDHNFFSEGPPLLFESMVFGGPLDETLYRYATWDEAEAGHRMLIDEAVVEGKVSTWEVREQLAALAKKSREGSAEVAELIARSGRAARSSFVERLEELKKKGTT